MTKENKLLISQLCAPHNRRISNFHIHCCSVQKVHDTILSHSAKVRPGIANPAMKRPNFGRVVWPRK
jgi:hypothetical protein